MILLQNLSKSIAGKLLFQNFNLTIHRDDRIGIVGPNGAGKSTLLKMLAGIEHPDDGSIETEKECVGYLEQAIPSEELSLSVGEYLKSYKPQEIETGLAKVQLDIDSSLLISQLSGGQKTKLALVKVLFDKPTALLLDEPTNHLDQEAITILENLIQNFPGAVLIVSHDRKLLDNCAKQILEIDPVEHKIESFSGNFTAYWQARQERRARQTELYESWKGEKQRMEKMLKMAQIAAAKESAHSPKVKHVKKRLQSEVYDQEIIKPQETIRLPNLQIAGDSPSGKLMVRVREIAKTMGSVQIFDDASLEIRGGERVLLEGNNGSGKTTLTKMILGEILPDRGEIQIGNNVKIGYFDQEHATLTGNETVLDHFVKNSVAPKANPRGILAAFGFRRNDALKSIQFLSHGEQVRLILAIMVQSQYDMLILDEPTNHLDLVSREIIEIAVKDYQGALLIISHDRYFVEMVGIDKAFVVASGKLDKIYG